MEELIPQATDVVPIEFSADEQRKLSIAYAFSDVMPVSLVAVQGANVDRPINQRRRSNIKNALRTATVFIVSFAALSVVHGAEQDHIDAQSIPNQSIDVSNVPANIPKAVAKQIGKALSINVIFSKYVEIGSGIQLNNNEIISAGHLLTTTSKKEAESLNTCQNIEADTPIGIEYAVQYGQSVGPNTASSIPDISLLRTIPDQYSAFPYNPNPKGSRLNISTNPVSVNQILYFVNYEPRANKTPRDPLADIITGWNNMDPNPAIYAGIVQATAANGDYAVVTGIKGYGTDKERFSRGGASGGPVFDSNGNLVGISDQIGEGSFTSTLHDEDNNLESKGMTHETKDEMTLVQPITALELGTLTEKLEASKACNNGN